MSKQENYECGSAFKEGGLISTWRRKLLIYLFDSHLLLYWDVQEKQQKQISVLDYTLSDLGLYQSKWSLLFKNNQREHKFGWNSQLECRRWLDCFSGIVQQMEEKLEEQKVFAEFETNFPESERIQTLSLPSMMLKPSALSRRKIEEMIPFLPQFIQKDMELLLENTLENLQGFSDIQRFKRVFDDDNVELYQDPNDPLHMKLMYYSLIEPRRIYDAHTMPTCEEMIPHMLKSFKLFPTKKGCSLIYMELNLKQLDKQKNSAREIDEINEEDKIQKPKQGGSKSLNHQTNNNDDDFIRVVFTQKGFEKDGIYCIFRKYTGKEIYHDQIDQDYANELNKYRITRSALVIQPTNKNGFKSQLIEEVYVECDNEIIGEKMLKLLLFNVTSTDKNLMQINKEIQQKTENVITKHYEKFETLQISFRISDIELQRITSEQHQVQSKEEYIKVMNAIESGQYVKDAITHYSDQSIISGLDQKLITTPEDGHFLYTKYYEVDQKKGGLIYNNKRLLGDQRTVIFDVIKRMGSNLISGRSLMSVSLPIQIFESRSFLERMARAQGHAPVFLESAAQSLDPFEQMKQTIAFNMSSFMMGIQQEKPFNPILGETFQGRILGCPIYLEQTSHHPPISNYIMFGRGYKLFGAFCPSVDMGANSLSGEQHGHAIIQFNNTNLKFYYIYQPFNVYGIVMGERTVNCHKSSFCFQPELQLLAAIQYNPKDKNARFWSSCKNQKIDFFNGHIYKVTKQCIERCQQAHKTNTNLCLQLKVKPEDILETYDQITGRWTSHLEFNGIKYWDITKHNPYILELEANPLPSDCLYRKDLLLMKMKDLVAGQDMKEQMEVDQRKDKKLRESKKKKK